METAIATGRFAILLNEEAAAREKYDEALLMHPDWVVAPTLGAIVPGWLIIVPRKAALNFHHWIGEQSKSPEAVIGELLSHLGLAAEDVIWFEHGSAAPGSIVGCGMDYAHLHVLLRPSFPFAAFLKRAISMSKLSWISLETSCAYASLPKEESYLIAGCGKHATFASQVASTGSQFFRRVVASLSGRAESWDYRHHAHSDNIAQTIETFRKLERDARRGR